MTVIQAETKRGKLFTLRNTSMMVILAIMVSACGSSSRGTTGESLSPTPNTKGTLTASYDTAATDKLSKYLYKKFGSPGKATSWYGRIKTFRVFAGTARVETDVNFNDGEPDVAKTICTVVIGAPEIESAVVTDQKDVTLWLCGPGYSHQRTN